MTGPVPALAGNRSEITRATRKSFQGEGVNSCPKADTRGSIERSSSACPQSSKRLWMGYHPRFYTRGFTLD